MDEVAQHLGKLKTAKFGINLKVMDEEESDERLKVKTDLRKLQGCERMYFDRTGISSIPQGQAECAGSIHLVRLFTNHRELGDTDLCGVYQKYLTDNNFQEQFNIETLLIHKGKKDGYPAFMSDGNSAERLCNTYPGTFL